MCCRRPKEGNGIPTSPVEGTKKRETSLFLFGARNRTWTCTSCDTRTWNVRVYQFRHPGNTCPFVYWDLVVKKATLSCSFCAQDKTWTCTALRRLPPQSSVSTNSTTWAFLKWEVWGMRFEILTSVFRPPTCWKQLSVLFANKSLLTFFAFFFSRKRFQKYYNFLLQQNKFLI